MKTIATIATILLLASPAFAQDEACDDLNTQIEAILAQQPNDTVEVFHGDEAKVVMAYIDNIVPRPDEAKDADTVVVVSVPEADSDMLDSVALVKGQCIEVVGHITHGLSKRALGNPA